MWPSPGSGDTSGVGVCGRVNMAARGEAVSRPSFWSVWLSSRARILQHKRCSNGNRKEKTGGKPGDTKVKSHNYYLGQRENVESPVRPPEHEKSCQHAPEDHRQALGNHLQTGSKECTLQTLQKTMQKRY